METKQGEVCDTPFRNPLTSIDPGRDQIASRYWTVVDELGMIDLKETELKLFRRLLDEQFRARRPYLRITQKDDLFWLTGVEYKNLLRTIEALKQMGMVTAWNTDAGYVIQAVADPAFWIAGDRRKVDRTGYIRALAQLRAYNAGDTPDPYFPSLAPEKSLEEALAESFVPMRSPAGGLTPAGDYHQNRGTHGVQGDIRESGPMNAVRPEGKSGADPAQAGSALTSEGGHPGKFNQPAQVPAVLAARASVAQVPQNRAAQFPPTRTAGPLTVPSLIERMRAAVDDPPPEPSTEIQYSPREKPPDGGAAVLKFSTDGEKERGDPGGEYLNSVLASGPVLKFSTPDRINNDNGTALKSNTLTMFIAAVAAGEIVLERGASPAQIGGWLQRLGAFAGPPGTYWAASWMKLCNTCPRGVEKAVIALVEKVREEGVDSVSNCGGWMRDRLKAWGYIKGKGKG